MIKLIGLDLDDTLLNSEKKISKEDIKTVKDAIKKGCKIVFTSGRPLSLAVISYYQTIGLTNGEVYYLGFNGEAVYDIYAVNPSKKCIYSDCLNNSDLQMIENSLSFLYTNNTYNVTSYVYKDGEKNNTSICYAQRHNKFIEIEVLYNKVEIEYLNDQFKPSNYSEVHKFMIAGEPSDIEKIYRLIPASLFENFNVVISMPCFIEIFKKGNDKYQGLLYVAKKYQIERNEILAIGDSMNDYEMIKQAHIGIAMGNSCEEVQEVSTFVTRTCEESGVSVALKKFVLSEGK